MRAPHVPGALARGLIVCCDLPLRLPRQTRRCGACRRILPRRAFWHSPQKIDHLSCVCRECMGKRRRGVHRVLSEASKIARRERIRQLRIGDYSTPAGLGQCPTCRRPLRRSRPSRKRCPSCGVRRKSSRFGHDPIAATHLESWCRKCRNAKLIRWQKANPEKHREQCRRFRRRHATRLREEIRAYRRKHPRLTARRHRDYMNRNPGLNATYTNRWKARRLGALVDDVQFIVVMRRDRFTCRLCGVGLRLGRQKWPNRATLHHVVPLSRGGPHSYANVVAAHMSCNARVGTKIVEVLPA